MDNFTLEELELLYDIVLEKRTALMLEMAKCEKKNNGKANQENQNDYAKITDLFKKISVNVNGIVNTVGEWQKEIDDTKKMLYRDYDRSIAKAFHDI